MRAIKTQLNVTDKIPLHECVPLKAPFVLALEPSGLCNLRCRFCTHSVPAALDSVLQRRSRVLMTDDVFNKIVGDLKEFDRPLKLIYFSQIGEPLLNKQLPDMINRLHKEKLTHKSTIFTNAIPLTEEMSLALVDAGLTRIKISVNGLCSEDYKQNCDVAIDFERFVKQIAFLYKNKKNLIVQIKTIDMLLKPGDEERFYKIFGDVCDQIDIELMFPIFDGVPYDDLYFQGSAKPASRYASTLRGGKGCKICALPFYRMAVAADGAVNLCYTDIADGNVMEKSLKEVWEGDRRKNLLTNLLQQKFEGISEGCDKCVCGHEQADEKDNLYPYRNAILQRGLTHD